MVLSTPLLIREDFTKSVRNSIDPITIQLVMTKLCISFLKYSMVFLLAISSVLLFSFSQTDSLGESIKRGEEVYAGNCMSCHMADGNGLEGVFPPLASTGRLIDKNRIIPIVINGLQGQLVVNGKEYNSEMFPQNLNDKEIADVLNYVRNSWTNKAAIIQEDEVRQQRASLKK